MVIDFGFIVSTITFGYLIFCFGTSAGNSIVGSLVIPGFLFFYFSASSFYFFSSYFFCSSSMISYSQTKICSSKVSGLKSICLRFIHVQNSETRVNASERILMTVVFPHIVWPTIMIPCLTWTVSYNYVIFSLTSSWDVKFDFFSQLSIPTLRIL